MGMRCVLFAPDYLISRIQKIVDTHEIECVGVFEAKEKIDVVTSDIDKAVKGADYIILCVPAIATKNMREF